MKVVIQRSKEAEVVVEGDIVGAIKGGMVLLIGIAKEDSQKEIEEMALKISKLRIFEDDAGKMNLNVLDSGGKILSVPQFTLLADTKKGNRPGFDRAADPDKAKELWVKFNEALRGLGIEVEEGRFAAHMEVRLANDGPVTLVLESR